MILGGSQEYRRSELRSKDLEIAKTAHVGVGAIEAVRTGSWGQGTLPSG
jgi:hypothetical protein